MKFNILDLACTHNMSDVLSHFKAAFAPNYALDPKLAGLYGDCVVGTYLARRDPLCDVQTCGSLRCLGVSSPRDEVSSPQWAANLCDQYTEPNSCRTAGGVSLKMNLNAASRLL